MTKKFVRDEWKERSLENYREELDVVSPKFLDLFQSFEERIEEIKTWEGNLIEQMIEPLISHNANIRERFRTVEKAIDILKENINEIKRSNNFPEINGLIDEWRTCLQVNYKKLNERLEKLEEKDRFFDENSISTDEFVSQVVEKSLKSIEVNKNIREGGLEAYSFEKRLSRLEKEFQEKKETFTIEQKKHIWSAIDKMISSDMEKINE